MALTLSPDVEKVVSDYLRTHADIVALNTRIVGKTPDSKSTSWVRVTKLDAPQVNQPDWLRAFLVQCDCYAGATGGQPEANLLCRTVEAVLGALPNAGVRILGGPRGLDTDLEPARDRAITTAHIWLHP